MSKKGIFKIFSSNTCNQNQVLNNIDPNEKVYNQLGQEHPNGEESEQITELCSEFSDFSYLEGDQLIF